ncbi:MAG: UDP-N-acetylmuramoyl-L-alanyl-D-glutamate--2,6-diaminopimelate ligase [Dysgonamonadaceae bacterium]|jgi:UDP-N-acetylmuramoyl-L-alanyl-D-glutamate--2,6-diaminopimelate ligase|nr:UDP-N-acetylmuramoyl-L-alanyl-D-glutamate--2,6-diaminopimelate ligase [Dysgonamonadaceae bacterium]
MKLSELLKAIKPLRIVGEQDREVAAIHSDSRKIAAGYLFVAVPGTQSDGHDYIGKAIDSGAEVIVCQQLPKDTKNTLSYIQVEDSAEALACLAAAFYGNPSHKLVLVGVTGTNGKTTIATLLYQTFRKLGFKAGLLSTVVNYVDGRAVPATHTTPDPIELNSLLAEMVSAGCRYVFMEVSSHAIVQKRIAGLKFKGGIFTNLTRDHLDYHATFENYRDAKKAFFDRLPADAFALSNADDKNGLFVLQNTPAAKKTYSVQTLADFKGRILEAHFDGTLMSFNDREVNTQFVGKFNAYNLLAVYGAAVLLGAPSDDTLVIISTLQSVSGRFQTMRSPDAYTAIVDYAHTPDALTNVLNAIHGVLDGSGKVITVVGCGGNRDKGKRPIMAKEAVRLSDQVILTSDNPRFEEPQDILNDMLAGLDAIDRKKTLTIVDRREAIRTACLLANTGDVILVAGKGHEDYQDVKGVKHPFDDREVLQDIFENEI